MRLLFIILTFLFLMSPSFSYAEKETFEEPPPKKSEAYYKELDRFYNYCLQDTMSWYYDCECLTLRYMDEWEKLPPDTPEFKILKIIGQECPNSANIGTQKYNQCMDWAYKVRKDYDNFCKCYAKAYVKRYETGVSLHPLITQRRMAESLNECGYGEDIMRQYHKRRKLRDQKEEAVQEQEKRQKEAEQKGSTSYFE